MSFVEHIKHAPRWTWYTVGGVTAGAVAIKLWKGRAAPASSPAAGDGTTAGDAAAPGSWQPATSGGSPPGVIVPPIITGGDSSGGADWAAAFAGLVGGTIDDLTGLVGTVVTGDQANMALLIGGQQTTTDSVLGLIAGAGGPPGTVASNPTPVIIQMPAPSAPPAATAPQPTTVTKTCSSEYPLYPHHNSARGPVSPTSCYKTGCNSKHHKTRYYKGGDVDVLSPVQAC